MSERKLTTTEIIVILIIITLMGIFLLSGCGFIRTDLATYKNGQLLTWESTTAWTLGKTITIDANDFGYLSEPQDADIYTPYGAGKLTK